MKRIWGWIVTVGALAYLVFNLLPQYHQFEWSFVTLEPGYYWEFYSSTPSDFPVRFDLSENVAGHRVDAYLLDEEQYGIFARWTETDSTVEPELDYIRKWEGVSEVSEDGIQIPGDGTFVLLIDNSDFGPTAARNTVEVGYTLAERYSNWLD